MIHAERSLVVGGAIGLAGSAVLDAVLLQEWSEQFGTSLGETFVKEWPVLLALSAIFAGLGAMSAYYNQKSL